MLNAQVGACSSKYNAKYLLGYEGFEEVLARIDWREANHRRDMGQVRIPPHTPDVVDVIQV